MFRYALAFAAVSLVAVVTPAQEKKAPPDLKADLAALQGRWEQVKTSGPTPPKMKTVKEVSGDTETVYRYDADGKLLQAAKATIKLSESGGVRVLTFSGGEVIDGLGKGRKQPEAMSYIYRLDGDELYEVGGLLTAEKYSQDVPYLAKWKRMGVAARKPAAVEGDSKLLQGEWVFTSQEGEGEQVPASLLKPLRLTIDGDSFRVTTGGEVVQEGTATYDASQTPKTVDVSVTGGGGKGTKWLGIYKIDGDTVTLCFDPTGKKRPTEFKAAKGSGFFLNVHTRVKK
jgi:uncharacterized protein (TIGR03067 family)